jgi:oligopeptide transport system permease protein
MTVAKTEPLGALREAAATKPRGLWSDAWRRLKRNRASMLGAGIIVLFVLVAIFADLIAPHDPNQVFNDAASNSPPFFEQNSDPRYLLGTDGVARDYLSRLIFGTRISLLVGLVPVLLITLIGATIGITAAWLGGRWDNLIMRAVDVVYAFPALLFLIVVQTALRDSPIGNILGGLFLLFGALALVGWTDMARLVRGQVLSLKNKEFVEAARATGAPTSRILFRHILPNSLAPIIVSVAFGIPATILAEAALSFLGLGVKGSTPTWGSMVFDSFSTVLFAPSFVLMPAALIALIMLAFTFLGDGLRDALDPQMSR